MIKIDDNLLQEIGLGDLPETEKNEMLKHIYKELEMRVGMNLAARMSDTQLNEFEELSRQKDDAKALQWLETNFPDYKKVVENELNKLKDEIKKDASKIIEASS